MTGPLETNDMMVLTVRTPIRDSTQLTVRVENRIVCIEGPNGFRREVPLPAGADADRLHAGLFDDVLELRAPRTDATPSSSAHIVAVWPLT
jgi:HSP20 family molecular chaperone IbpA